MKRASLLISVVFIAKVLVIQIEVLKRRIEELENHIRGGRENNQWIWDNDSELMILKLRRRRLGKTTDWKLRGVSLLETA